MTTHKFGLAAVVAVALTLAAGCSSTSDTTTTVTAPPSTVTTTVTASGLSPECRKTIEMAQQLLDQGSQVAIYNATAYAEQIAGNVAGAMAAIQSSHDLKASMAPIASEYFVHKSACLNNNG